jgi:nitrous oxide reductase accessory protein NosL
MTNNDPVEFTLDNGMHVDVVKTGADTLEFTLKPEHGPARRFTYVDDEAYTAEVEDTLDFDQLNALRKYWLIVEERG